MVVSVLIYPQTWQLRAIPQFTEPLQAIQRQAAANHRHLDTVVGQADGIHQSLDSVEERVDAVS